MNDLFTFCTPTCKNFYLTLAFNGRSARMLVRRWRLNDEVERRPISHEGFVAGKASRLFLSGVLPEEGSPPPSSTPDILNHSPGPPPGHLPLDGEFEPWIPPR